LDDVIKAAGRKEFLSSFSASPAFGCEVGDGQELEAMQMEDGLQREILLSLGDLTSPLIF